MPQRRDRHREQLLLAPAEDRGGGGIDAGPAPREIRHPDQVVGDAPEPVALARARRDLLLERFVEPLQRHLGVLALGRLDRGHQHAADARRRRGVRHRAVAEGEERLLGDPVAARDREPQILGEERAALAGEDRTMDRLELLLQLRPRLAERQPERIRVLVAEDRQVAVIVDQHEVRPPAQPHRKRRGQDGGDHQGEARRPARAWARAPSRSSHARRRARPSRRAPARRLRAGERALTSRFPRHSGCAITRRC